MVYLYGNDDCPKCRVKEKELTETGIAFEKRDSSRIKAPEDDIDREALIVASMQNMELPVVINSTSL